MIVVTNSGPIRGKLEHYNDVSYFSYRGIPYAEAPIGSLRFLPPVPKKPWKEVFDATKFGPVCPQRPGIYSLNEMSEDCLTLNVYVPKTTAGLKIPVLIETHSSEFRKRSARDDVWGPQFFMKSGVILVTYQFRLGALGFISTKTEEAPGNAGLKDTLLVLKWVRENVGNFGGDVDNITIGGNSSGAVTVHFCLLSKQCTGLFHRAILRSGSAIGYRFLDRYPVETALALGSEMGCQTNDTYELIEYLRRVDVFDIINATVKLEDKDKRQGARPSTPFRPVIERISTTAFITEDPLDIIKSGMPQNVPLIVGFNSHEGIGIIPTIRKNPALLEYLNVDFELCIPSDIEYPYRSAESMNLAKSIKDFYFGKQVISSATMHNYIDFMTDSQFGFSIDRWIQIHKGLSNCAPIYYYLFDFDGDLNFFKINYDVKMKGTAHVDDYGYMFATEATKPLLKSASAESLQTKEIIMALNSNFVKYGTPTPSPQLTNKVCLSWPNYCEVAAFLTINNNPYVVKGFPFQQRLKFWYDVYENYDNYVKNGGVLQPKIEY